jgi:hypothetical protein
MDYKLVIFALLILTSCAGYRTTSMGAITQHMGVDRDYIINKYGTPFKVDAYSKNNKEIEIISYKEVVDVGPYTYILTTNLYMENNKLIKVTQQEDVPPNRTVISTNNKDKDEQ